MDNVSFELNTSSSDLLGSLDSRWLTEKINIIQTVVTPILLVIGVIGNTFIVITVSQSEFRKMTTRLLLTALAFSDSITLVTSIFNQTFIVTAGEKDPRAISTFGCKLFFVVYRTAKISSSWFIVGIAIERFCAVVFPLHVKRIIQRRNVFIYIISTYILTIGSTSFWSFSSGISKEQICLSDLVPPGGRRRHKIHLIISATGYTFGPFVTLLCLTPPIILKLIYRQKIRRNIVLGTRETSGNELSRMSAMLLITMVSWIIWITPITVVLTHTLWTYEPILGSSKTGLMILQATAQFCEQINHSCNFVIYVMFCTQFRRRFFQIVHLQSLTRLCRPKVTPVEPLHSQPTASASRNDIMSERTTRRDEKTNKHAETTEY